MELSAFGAGAKTHRQLDLLPGQIPQQRIERSPTREPGEDQPDHGLGLLIRIELEARPLRIEHVTEGRMCQQFAPGPPCSAGLETSFP